MKGRCLGASSYAIFLQVCIDCMQRGVGPLHALESAERSPTFPHPQGPTWGPHTK